MRSRVRPHVRQKDFCKKKSSAKLASTIQRLRSEEHHLCLCWLATMFCYLIHVPLSICLAQDSHLPKPLRSRCHIFHMLRAKCDFGAIHTSR